MSKAAFEAARELIQEKRYDEARAILRNIDDPRAAQWLAKLDRMSPPPKKASGGAKYWIAAITGIVGALIGFAAGAVVFRSAAPSAANNDQLAAFRTDFMIVCVSERTTRTPVPDAEGIELQRSGCGEMADELIRLSPVQIATCQERFSVVDDYDIFFQCMQAEGSVSVIGTNEAATYAAGGIPIFALTSTAVLTELAIMDMTWTAKDQELEATLQQVDATLTAIWAD